MSIVSTTDTDLFTTNRVTNENKHFVTLDNHDDDDDDDEASNTD